MPPQVLHFHDPRIINPDVRDELLQAIYKLLQSAVSAMLCLSSANDCPDHHGSNAAKGEPSLNWAPMRLYQVALCLSAKPHGMLMVHAWRSAGLGVGV